MPHGGLRHQVAVAIGQLKGACGGAGGKIVPLFHDDAEGMTAVDYAAAVNLPDFHFHMAIAYAILRHNGVPFSKADLLGKPDTVASATGPR